MELGIAHELYRLRCVRSLRRRRFTPRAMQGRGGGETVSFKNIHGRMGGSLREVANESLECSEL